MKVAYTIGQGKGDTDLLLYNVANELSARGLRTAGTAQINVERQGTCRCDMDIKVLPEGPVIRISQNLGVSSRGCRLDPDALEQAVAMVQRDLFKAQCLIVNKFGKHEAEGRGFRAVIADALALDLPVLVGLNRLNEDAFFQFVQEEAVELAPDTSTLLNWLQTNIPMQDAVGAA